MFPEYPGLGVATWAQRVPFQCSASVLSFPYVPTAQMSDAEAALIPVRSMYAPPAGLGAATSAQRVPFQCAARAWAFPAAVV